MASILLRRLAQAPLVLLLLAMVSYGLMRVAPGGPFDGERKLDPATERAQAAYFRLDLPLHRQFAHWLGSAVHGDLGWSMRQQGRTVNEIIADRLPASALLGALALLVALAIGLPAGLVASARHNRWPDHAAMGASLLGLSVPAYVIGPLLALVVGLWLAWLPPAGWGGARHLALPVLTLALPYAARIARLMRAGMLEVVHQDFVRTARAKGLSEPVVLLRHAARGGVLPVVAFLGPAAADLLTGSLVVEQIFQVPGLGREFVESALSRDYTLVMGTVLVYGALVLALNLLSDVALALLDPRVRLS